MKKVLDLTEKCIAYLICVLFATFTGLTIVQVIFRFVIQISISWSDEVVRACFIWMIFLGAAIGVRNGMHLALDLFSGSMSPRVQKIVRIIILILIGGASAILLYASYDFVVRNIGISMIILRGVPLNVVYVAIPISAFLMIVYTIERLALELCRKEGQTWTES